MSGIAGVVWQGGAPVDEALLARMAESLAFRGPHGSGAWSGGSVGLVHARLDTGDETDPPTQPLTLDGAAWIVADARSDGRAELAAALHAAGEDARADAPAAELILRAWRAWGEQCVSKLIGDFAFAVWDARTRTLFCARDHFGVRPLHYAALPDAFVFSNTLDTVRLHPAVGDALNERAVGDFLLFGANLDLASTLFARVSTLPPAHALVLRDGSFRVSRWWAPPVDGEPVRGGAREVAERFDALFGRAVADRTPRGRCAILLSGGMDSTAVAAAARRERPETELRGFTAGWERRMDDTEPRFARLAAEALGIGWDHLPLDPYHAYAGWDALRDPEPVDDPLRAMSVDLYRRAAAFAPAALTGQGGDVALRQSESRLARLILGGRIARAVVEGVEYAAVHRRLPRPGFRTLRARRSGRLDEPWPLPAWLDANFARRLDLAARNAEAGVLPPSPHPLRPEAHRLLGSPFLTRMLEAFDAGRTGVALSFRHPFLDVRLIDFLLRVLPAQWYNDKGVLKIAMRGRLPPEILRRPKTVLAGEPVPVLYRDEGASWLGGRRVSADAARFVDPSRLPRAAGGDGPDDDLSRLHEDLRPLTLSLWLASLRR